jgi:predicted ATPase/DNA-binding winged helix-turn-helix (wHTH) protein
MENDKYRCETFFVDAENQRFTSGDHEIVLENKVLAVMLRLLSRPDTLITREELLDSVWGHRFVTPSTLNRVIKLARRAFGDDAGQPRFIETVRGAGYRFIGPVERIPKQPGPPEARFRPPRTMRLPAGVDRLIGREEELAQIRTLLDAHRAVTVLGTGGMGKTRCALEFARRNSKRYPDGVWFFDLVSVQNATEWLYALAAALSVRASDEAVLLDRLSRQLAGRRVLLLLDNCDRFAPEVGAYLLPLLRATDELRVLSTSQQPLGFVGEQRMWMPPLALPAEMTEYGKRDTLAQTRSAPAVALLLERAAEVLPGFVMTEANRATVVEICRRLDGMPLAIELAAARLAALSPRQVLDGLERRFGFLSSDLAGRDPRHRNLLALLEWSYNLLSGPERRFLRRLSVFVQGWSIEAAVEIAESLGHDKQHAVDLLGTLVNKSLVTVNQGLTAPRYRLLESVREFAHERLIASGEERRARDAHLAYIRKLAASINEDVLAGRVRARLPLLIQEDANIQGAIEYAAAHAETRESACAIVGSLLLYWRGRGSFDLASNFCRTLIRDGVVVDSPSGVRVLLGHGIFQLYTGGSRAQVESALSTALESARVFGDTWAETFGSAYLALCLANDGDADAAAPAAVSASAMADGLDDGLLRGLAGLARGWVEIARRNYAAALEHLRSVRNLGGDYHQHHFIEVYLGLVLFLLGMWDESALQLLEGLEAGLDFQNLRGMGGSIEGCAYLAAQFGWSTDAVELLGSASGIRERTGIPLFSFWVPHHRRISRELFGKLGREAFEMHHLAGREMRDEDAINRTLSMLSRIAAGKSQP